MRRGAALLLLSAAMSGQVAPPARAAEARSPDAAASIEDVRRDAVEAFDRGDWARVEAFLRTVRVDAPPAVHLLAGDLLFAMGRPEAAYPEHRAAAKGALKDQARLEAAIDLLASRRFPDACAEFA